MGEFMVVNEGNENGNRYLYSTFLRNAKRKLA